VVDAGSGAAEALNQRNVPLGRLQAVLLTGGGLTESADLDELQAAAQPHRVGPLLPVYGPPETVRLVDGLNAAAGNNGADAGLQAWGPSPEPGRSVIVFEGDGLVVSAFTTTEDVASGRVGYRFDYRGRSLVVAGDGRAEWASASTNADVVLHSAQTTALAHLHRLDSRTPTVAEVAAAARDHNATLVLTGAGDDRLAGALQVSEARAAGLNDVVAGRVGMLLELPLENQDVNVRPL
jgi:ribonuclease Z